MQQPNNKQIFKNGSTTYYYSSFFFPKNTWEKVATLYAYVRTLDNFVDEMPQDKKSFYDAVLATEQAWQGKKVDDAIVQNFVDLAKNHSFEYEWIQAFLQSMYNDLHQSAYQTYEELEEYIFGSASVIGLAMSKLLDLPQQAHFYAQKQGEAMQLINFIRDIVEDCSLGRQYVPQQDLDMFGVKNLCHKPQSQQETQAFFNLVRFEVDRYRKLQTTAEAGYHFIPYRYRVPIATAAYLYKWTADTIYKNPLLIFKRKVKPSKWRVLLTGIRMAIKWR